MAEGDLSIKKQTLDPDILQIVAILENKTRALKALCVLSRTRRSD